MSDPIAYHEFDGRDGLALVNGLLVAHRDGVEVARAEVAEDSPPLAELLEQYRVPQILAAHCFAHGGRRQVLDITVTVDFPLPSSFGGHLRCGEDDGYWSAERRGANRFLMADSLPEAARPYASKEERGFGWMIELPRFVRELEDQVIRKRIGAGVERLLYRLADDNVTELPYSFRVDNVFSVERPMWVEALPWVVDRAGRGR